ncbi:MAG: Crp/Fnr family transcriptional regulator [Gammaproteobacteria bacterium]|nr:Crp/Fnr family transcriptional regulator [Gammaproteobacteria bacterium]
MKLQFLKQLPLFAHLNKERLEDVATSFELRSYCKNEIIFQEGQQADKLFIVCDGSVKVFKSNSDGKEHILHIMLKNSVIAEVAMFEGGRYPASCAALSDSMLCNIPREKFIALIKDDAQVALNILALQAKRLREFALKIEQLSLKTAEQKFLHFLLENASTENNVTIARTKGLNIQELANYLGTARENLSRIINKLVNNGVIEKHENGFLIANNWRKI